MICICMRIQILGKHIKYPLIDPWKFKIDQRIKTNDANIVIVQKHFRNNYWIDPWTSQNTQQLPKAMWNMWVHVSITMHNVNSIQRRKRRNGKECGGVLWWYIVTWGIFKNIYVCTRAPPCKWSFQTNLSPHTRRREVRWQTVMCKNITTMPDWCGGGAHTKSVTMTSATRQN